MNRRYVSLEVSRSETFGPHSFLPKHTANYSHKPAMASSVGSYLERFFPTETKYDQLDDEIDPVAAQERWLKKYYFARAAFSATWVAAAFTVGTAYHIAAAVLLVVYPLWDAAANVVDAQRSGGLANNQTQAVNVLASAATAVAVVVALAIDMHWVLGVYGAWAILSGLMQLGSGARRWRTAGAQWVMCLSGAQSALAGGFFIYQATEPEERDIRKIAGYAAFGAFYFLISALWLAVKGLWQSKKAGDSEL
ncbi:hypothetical protein F5Y17DRAFT_356995 [Xylariaceae sp. FL0594]|nr:hypothetical protein F5Y17DRAFT_356995 [Xylariaceae sp. FL0594]